MNKIILPLIGAVAATGATAQTPRVIDISLSPSGTKVAYVAEGANSTEAVYVAELAAGGGTPKPILVHPDEASELRRCRWANEDRLVCRLHFSRDGAGNPQDFWRIFAMDGQGKGFVALSTEDMRALAPGQVDRSVLAAAPGGKRDAILMTRAWVPGVLTTTRVSQDESGLGVEEVDLADGTRRRIEQPDPAVSGYTADETGRIRLRFGQSFRPGGPPGGERHFSYRDAESDRWREMAVTGADGAAADFQPVMVDSATNLAYGFIQLDGRRAAASLTLAGQGRIEVLARRADADADAFVTVGSQRRVVGVAFAGQAGETHYLDDGLGKLSAGLSGALPGQPTIRIAGSSADANRLLVVAGDASGTAMAYLFERDTRQLSEVMPVSPPEGGLVDGL